MVEWYFIVISIIIVVYVSCWLGVEMLAYNLNYQMTHTQKFFVPTICLLAAVGILFSDNVLIDFQRDIPSSRGFIKFRLIHSFSNKMLFAEYLFHGGKLSLCMWAVHEVYCKKNMGKIPFRKFYYLLQVLEIIEKKVIERTFPILKDLTYSVSITLSAFSFSFAKIPKKSRKTTMNLNNNKVYSKAVLDYGQ